MTPQAMPDSIPGGGMFTYHVSDPDKESWRPAWRLEVGRDGQEYGKPMKLPKDPQALARYLAKRRIDGGRLFTLNMPARIAPEGQFQCFVAPEACQKKSPTKGALVDHMEGCHPAESRHYAPFIKEIRDSIAAENPALAAMVRSIAATPDNPSLDVPEQTRAQYDAAVPAIPAPAPPAVFSVNLACQVEGCDWQPKPGTAKPEFARLLHVRAKHPEQE
nr:hypothetical protein WG33_0365 [uncultured bacterium]